jgi:F-type H+-transporting ATPase subunit a
MLAIPPLAAEPIFTIIKFPVTNTYINSSLTVLGFIVFAFLLNRGIKKYYGAGSAPKGLLNFFEAILEVLYKYIDQVTGDRKKSIKFLPLVGSLFFFILVSNWIGLLPGIGSIGTHQIHHGVLEFIPLFRPANTDLNMTLAMAVLVVATSHVAGIAAIGFFKYANKFVKLGDLWHGFTSMSPIKIVVALVEFMVGLLEIVSEVAKMVSLSLRLFGNIFAGEVLLTVIGSILAFVLPLPFMGLEIIVGLIQAVVFSMLALVYLTIATSEIKAHDSDHTETDIAVPTP